ncbi:MAG: NUDIX hydrolase [Bradyrhizobium sp.]|nr:NUDIX hydrolase [Bradyrhizobium sp.]MBV8918634.1 NUDIX hydrolase [Bradyrhizobium sp.]MBV9982818.1 NUDIX hydrolase [Bradyrhizobium sp.]
MQSRIAKTVGALFVHRSGEVLLGLRAAWKASWPLHWDTIGGRVEDGEGLEEALVREIQEEAGVTPTKFCLLAIVRESRPEIYGDALHHVYAVTGWEGGEPSNVSDEHTEFRWFSIGDMRTLTNIVDPDYPRLAQQALSGDEPGTD